MELKPLYDVIIIGGSYAGLSAAMALGRSLKNTLIIDNGIPCNRQTPHSHNFITQDGEKPKVIAERAREQVAQYKSIEFLNAKAIKGKKLEGKFEIQTEEGDKIFAKKLIFATGIKDLLPEIKGFTACWGISVIHCPYCHGYEFKGKKTAIMIDNEKAFHIAQLVNNLTDNITILTSGKTYFSDVQLQKLKDHHIDIIDKEVLEIVHHLGNINAVTFTDGSQVPFDAIYASVPFIQHSQIPQELGCELNEQGYIKTDSFQMTNIEGVFACGDNTSPMRSVANAVAAGNLTGAMVNYILTEENF
ncbi:thioredoxin reductase [Sphingobacterium mizutaii NBRC 14946 = DSM 11724]|uniref:Thioredoxin reductase n=2 Tax=Sphingobacterium mizutaii TaxID=1010 RepID=A0AAJ4XBM4_9SPHI|nr:NAD(P)/FAD-dependent oxidoreductase [Sphingobacterium mizutaii]GEM69556.1 thioredoxin reductase [Sphingobacterium mizutaii NBRC 14946 = DSM 11724]SDK91500.1 Thioredoxin reductase [Sphingobacterium mizutaii]SNV47808.1 Thioredoxin reductase [Sphingobacterium mizutaii]